MIFNNITVTNEMYNDMRFWLIDCGANLDGISAFEIIKSVARTYAGGLEQFILDGE